MPACKYCGVHFDWGNDGDRWIPLIPSGEESAGMEMRYVDSDGELRAPHAQICTRPGTSAVRVKKLREPIVVGEKAKVEFP